MGPFHARSRPGDKNNAICWIRRGEALMSYVFYRRSVRVTVKQRRSSSRRILAAEGENVPFDRALSRCSWRPSLLWANFICRKQEVLFTSNLGGWWIDNRVGRGLIERRYDKIMVMPYCETEIAARGGNKEGRNTVSLYNVQRFDGHFYAAQCFTFSVSFYRLVRISAFEHRFKNVRGNVRV